MKGLEAGSTLGGYKILARIRSGAMGSLYLARRMGPAGFTRPVAIKVIHEHLAQNKRFARLFIDEAKLTAQIDDPHVIRVEEFGQESGRYFLVMEYVHGLSLSQVIGVLRKRNRQIPIDIAVAIAMQIAIGLHGAHEATDEHGEALNIVHRDVSPGNILVSYTGYVRLIDFGIAKARDVGIDTQTGSMRGKLSYMPPEQARSAKHVDRRADIYCVGLILWEMLAGKRMLDAKTDLQLLNMIKDPPIVPPSSHSPNIPKALDAIVLQALSQDPDGRPPTGTELQRLLATACPEALQVLPTDIAALMKTVRDLAVRTDEDIDDDIYGDEVRKTLTIFGRSMLERREAEEAVEDTQRKSVPADPSSPSMSVIVDEELGQRTERMNISQFLPRHVSSSSSPPQSDPRATVRMQGIRSEKSAHPFANITPNAVLVSIALFALLLSTLVVVMLIVRDSRRQDELQQLRQAASASHRPSIQPPPSMVAMPPQPQPTLTANVVTETNQPEDPPTASSWLSSSPTPRPKANRVSSVEKAREAALRNDPATVRNLLEPKVRSGHATPEEVALVREACKTMRDRSCVDDIKLKYP